MPEQIQTALAVPGLVWLMMAIGASGLVRGFAGFGTAMIFIPVATQFLPPADVVLLMTLTGLASSSLLMPRAWRQGARAEVALMAAPALIAVPVGVWFLTRIDPLTLRWIVAVAASLTLAALITGYRYQGQVGRRGLLAIGSGAGVLGGLTGLTGPVVILFYLASPRSPQVIRANTILFLAALDVIVTGVLLVSGVGDPAMIWLAIVLLLPYLTATMIGQSLFRPQAERLYRWVAYGVIACAVLTGLPVFD